MKVPSPIVVQVSKDMSSQRVYKYQICISNHNKRIAITELGDKAEISEGMRYRLGAMAVRAGRGVGVRVLLEGLRQGRSLS